MNGFSPSCDILPGDGCKGFAVLPYNIVLMYIVHRTSNLIATVSEKSQNLPRKTQTDFQINNLSCHDHNDHKREINTHNFMYLNYQNNDFSMTAM